MKREESIKILKCAGLLGIVSLISGLLMKVIPVYGANALVLGVPYGYFLCETLPEKPRQGLLFTIVLLASFFTLPISLRLFGVMNLMAFCGELTLMFTARKKSAQRAKVSAITTLNTLIYPGLLVWELLATQGESTIIMNDFIQSLLIFVGCHVLGFAGVRLSLKDKVEMEDDYGKH